MLDFIQIYIIYKHLFLYMHRTIHTYLHIYACTCTSTCTRTHFSIYAHTSDTECGASIAHKGCDMANELFSNFLQS